MSRPSIVGVVHTAVIRGTTTTRKMQGPLLPFPPHPPPLLSSHSISFLFSFFFSCLPVNPANDLGASALCACDVHPKWSGTWQKPPFLVLERTVFTARCTLVQSAVLWSQVVCLSVTLVDCDHIGWNSSKIISPLLSLGCLLFATPT